MDRIASDTANIGGKLLRVEPDGTETEITSHPFLRFMDQPNPLYEMTGSAIWRLHEIYLRWWARASCSSSGMMMADPWSYGLCRRTG